MHPRAMRTDAETLPAAAGLGPWANGWLVIVAAISAIGALVNISFALDGPGMLGASTLTNFTPTAALGLGLLGLGMASGALLLLIARRRLGFLLICAACLAGFVLNLWIGVPPLRATTGLLGAALTAAFLYPRRHNLI